MAHDETSPEGARDTADRLPGATDRLREAQEWLSLALEATGAGTLHAVPYGRATVSPRFREMFGGIAEGAIKDFESFLLLLHPDDRGRGREAVARAVDPAGDGIYDAEYRCIWPDGSVHWIAAKGKSQFAEMEGVRRAVKFAAVTLDITDRKREEEALRASEARYARLAATVPGVLYEFERGADGSGRITYVSPRCKDLFELDAEVFLSDMEAHRRMFAPADFLAFDRISLAATRARVPFSAEARITTPSGKEKWVQFTSLPCPSPPGGPERRCGFILDVTDRKREEDSLRESEERFHTIADNIPQHAFMADARGEVFWLNRRVREYSGEASMGRGYLQLIHPAHVGRVSERIERSLKTGEPLEETFLLRGTDGGYRWFLTRVTALRDEAGQVVRWFGTNTDVTELRESEEALREADRRKSQFLAVLSHELRNPLAPIRNGLYLLACARPGSEQAGRAIEVIDRQTRHLTRLVDDLLDATRIAHGKIELHKERIDLRDVVRRVCDDHRSMFEQRGVGLRLEHPGPIWVEADSTRVTQAVGNLLQNALKFTMRGGMTWVSLGTEDGQAMIRVRDDGTGMQPDEVQRMFEPFAQADTSLARPHGGLGLGLALVKGVVELHGGAVAARSEGLGCGSEFVIRLPLCEPPVAAPSRVVPPAGHGKLILVIEDNVDACETLAQVLRVSGHRVAVALDGRTGIAEARRIVPDVVLCDIGLPDVDGHAVARTLRADPSLRATRLIALTGYAQLEDCALALEAGFDAHLAKPAALDDLEKLIAGAAGPARG